LVYERGDLRPAQRLVYKAHFAPSSHHLAAEVWSIIKFMTERADP
jgi:hypothetical protein